MLTGSLEERPMKIGARNQIIGTVTDVKKGNVMGLVKLEVPASKMASVPCFMRVRSSMRRN